MNSNEVSPYDIRQRLMPRYNCRIKQAPMSAKNCIEIQIDKLIKTKKLFNLIPLNEYEPTIKKLHIDYAMSIEKVYGNGVVEQSNIEIAYDNDSNTVYWRYSV